MAEALRPVAEKLAERLAVLAGPAKRQADRLGFLQRHLSLLADEGGERLGDEVNALGALLASGAADIAAIQRRVGRVERCLEKMLASYAEAQQADFTGEYSRGLELLLEIYRDLFRQAQGWLADFLEVCTNPKGAAEKRGLPTSGAVEIPLALKLTAPPALATLNDWLAEQKPADSGQHGIALQLTVTEALSASSPKSSVAREVQRRERQARDAAEQQAQEDSEALKGLFALAVVALLISMFIYETGWGFPILVGLLLLGWWMLRCFLSLLSAILGGGR